MSTSPATTAQSWEQTDLALAQKVLSIALSGVESVLGTAAKTAVGAAGAVAGSSSSTSVGITVGETDVISASVTAAGKIADALSAHEKIVNSPEMQQASEADKWQAFKDIVNSAEASGDEKKLEQLEGQ